MFHFIAKTSPSQDPSKVSGKVSGFKGSANTRVFLNSIINNNLCMKIIHKLSISLFREIATTGQKGHKAKECKKVTVCI